MEYKTKKKYLHDCDKKAVMIANNPLTTNRENVRKIKNKITKKYKQIM